MTLSHTRSLLVDLKLPGMNARLDWVLDEVRRHNWTIEEALDALLLLKIAYMEPFQDRVNGATPGSG